MERMEGDDIKKELISEVQRTLETNKKTPKEVLEDLAKCHLFLFHGSPNGKIKILEPRQAFNNREPDGQPAVFAIPSPECAIFMSIVSEKATAGWTDRRKPNPKFMIKKSEYDKQIKEKPQIGFVYVLDREDFRVEDEIGGRGYVSSEKVTPLAKIEVTEKDMPAFEVLPDEEYDALWSKD